MPLGSTVAGKACLVLARHETREYLDPALHDGEVVEAAPEALAAILDHPQAAAFDAVGRCQRLKANDAMGKAVDGLVVGVGGQVIQHQDSGTLLGEVVLHRQDLAAIAQGALGQQADLGQAVEHDPHRLCPLAEGCPRHGLQRRNRFHSSLSLIRTSAIRHGAFASLNGSPYR